MMKTSNFTTHLVKYEDQYEAEAVADKGRSLIAWLQMLEDLKVRVDRPKLDEYFRGNFGRFHGPTPHKESIVNFEEVEEVLKEGELEFLLRYT